MSDSEPGWYHAEGDPPSTMRFWTGSAWADQVVPVRQRSVWGWGRAVVMLLRIVVVLGVLLALLAMTDVLWLQSVRAGQDAGVRWADELGFVGTIALTVDVLVGIVFLVWFRRVYENSRSFTGTSRRSMTMAVVGWVIPGVQFVFPLAMMREVVPPNHVEPPLRPVEPSTLRWWWGMWVTSIVVSLLLQFSSPVSVDELVMQSYLVLVLELTYFVAAVLLIGIVLAVTNYQDSRLDPAVVSDS